MRHVVVGVWRWSGGSAVVGGARGVVPRVRLHLRRLRFFRRSRRRRHRSQPIFGRHS